MLVLPVFYFSVGTDSPYDHSLDQNPNDTVIYMSSGAMMVGGENIYHAKIVEESAKIEERSTKKAVVSKVDKPNAVVSLQKKSTPKIVLNPNKPKFVLKGSTTDQNFGVSNTLNNKNSVINPAFVERNQTIYNFTKHSVTIYVYLLNIYSADFSKTAELSQFLFTRPPPMI